jgi:hypothetical protein
MFKLGRYAKTTFQGFVQVYWTMCYTDPLSFWNVSGEMEVFPFVKERDDLKLINIGLTVFLGAGHHRQKLIQGETIVSVTSSFTNKRIRYKGCL